MNNLNLSSPMKKALQEGSLDEFRVVTKILKDKEIIVQNEILESTKIDVKKVIAKLKESDVLTKDDLKLIKIWLVGDAEGYLKMENNFNDWKEEYKRLITVFKKYEGKNISPKMLAELSGLIEDASRVSYSIVNYLNKKERVFNFESALKELPQSKDLLINILENKMKIIDS